LSPLPPPPFLCDTTHPTIVVIVSALYTPSLPSCSSYPPAKIPRHGRGRSNISAFRCPSLAPLFLCRADAGSLPQNRPGLYVFFLFVLAHSFMAQGSSSFFSGGPFQAFFLLSYMLFPEMFFSPGLGIPQKLSITTERLHPSLFFRALFPYFPGSFSSPSNSVRPGES